MISGLFGGTFDPIHYGHLITVEWVRSTLSLDRIILIPAGCPPHKDSAEISSAVHRLAMTEAAIRSNPWLHCSDIEICAEGISYTEQLIARFLQEASGKGDSFRLIIGADSLQDIHTWRNPDHILDMIPVIVMRRPGYSLGEVDPAIVRKVTVVETPLVAVSSSMIRRRIRAGKSITYLVPSEVESYIRENGLYR